MEIGPERYITVLGYTDCESETRIMKFLSHLACYENACFSNDRAYSIQSLNPGSMQRISAVIVTISSVFCAGHP